MSDPTYVTSFEDHAKRASVSLPADVLSDLPFDAGAELGVSREADGVVVVAEPHDGGSALLRKTERGTRLYLDRMLAYDAGLLGVDVVLIPRADELYIEPA